MELRKISRRRSRSPNYAELKPRSRGFSHFTLFCRERQKNVLSTLMTGPEGNSKFCFPETLNVSRGEAEENIEVEGKQNSLFPEGPVIKCFVTTPDSKREKAPKKIICLRPLHTLAALAKLSGCRKLPVLSKNNDNSLVPRS